MTDLTLNVPRNLSIDQINTMPFVFRSEFGRLPPATRAYVANSPHWEKRTLGWANSLAS